MEIQIELLKLSVKVRYFELSNLPFRQKFPDFPVFSPAAFTIRRRICYTVS